jgi:hypothetical protein
VSGFILAVLAMLGALLMATPVSAQNTIKPFQIRVEVPFGYVGTLNLLTNNVRIPTNGASVFDGTGTNWVIPDVMVSISGGPSGCTPSLVDTNGVAVSDIPVTGLNTNSTAKNTNVVVKLVFNGSQPSGTSTLRIDATGGLTNGFVFIVVEVGRIWNGNANAALTGPGNWNDPAMWSGGVPTPSDNVVFADVGTQTNSQLLLTGVSTNQLTNVIVNVDATINSLRFAQYADNTTNWHNLYINDGKTLAIKGSDGFSLLRDYTYVARKMNVTFAGTNGTMIVTNENANFAMLSDGQTASLLDMSALGNLHINVNRLPIGDILAYPNYLNLVTNGYTPGSTFGSSRPSKCLPTWRMPATN